MTEQRLAASLKQVLGDTAMVENAPRLGQLARLEGGVAFAAEQIARIAPRAR